MHLLEKKHIFKWLLEVVYDSSCLINTWKAVRSVKGTESTEHLQIPLASLLDILPNQILIGQVGEALDNCNSEKSLLLD